MTNHNPRPAFQVSNLSRDRFEELLDLDDEGLKQHGVQRHVADRKPGFPCRVSLKDAEPGEPVILLSFQHQPADSPYRASGPIFIRQSAVDACLSPGTVPELLRARLLSVRAYDSLGSMRDCDVVEGRDVETLVARFFDDDRVDYLHVHSARPGCYLCRIDRG